MVDQLFNERWPKGRKMATVEVAQFVSETINRHVDRQYIYRIRTGKVTKVDAVILDAIAKFFGKPLNYFSRPSSNSEDDDLSALLVTLRSRDHVTPDDLTPEAREELARLLRQAREVIDGGTTTSQKAG
ncbi:hypothetical protein [Nocardia neocaledoniensis]|uniref:hypothetical protein n=1 Tax=Nocardia neocaledoniensis TaxID=236511 RepID=UPI002455B666|nr:hypothetical protein [Nocardia neocaledoniensis]